MMMGYGCVLVRFLLTSGVRRGTWRDGFYSIINIWGKFCWFS